MMEVVVLAMDPDYVPGDFGFAFQHMHLDRTRMMVFGFDPCFDPFGLGFATAKWHLAVAATVALVLASGFEVVNRQVAIVASMSGVLLGHCLPECSKA